MARMIKRIVIAGGGTAGWMAAAALAKTCGHMLQVQLVESDTLGTIGVGESTIPPLRAFHQLLKIDEAEFMRATAATFKLGVNFEGWGTQHSDYMHAFGTTGRESWIAGFQHLWLLARERGLAADFGDYCFELKAARAHKFELSANAPMQYAYHLDANRYAHFLRRFSERHGAVRIEGKIVRVEQNVDSGFIEALTLESGQQVHGDLFIDCTGFKGLLIEQTLNTGFEDWSHWLPCDSAWAVQTEAVDAPVPFTRAIAHGAGWRWRIPLQHRVGNGLVYSSHHLDEAAARRQLLAEIVGEPVTEPRLIRYRTGRRLHAWRHNCIALGLAAGFVEPLESTGIHLFMTAITRLLQMLPLDKICSSVVREYNAQTRREIEKIRDFIVLHYHVSQRADTPFWRLCRSMELPPGLQDKIDLFRESAQVFREEGDPFRADSWTQVMLGQGLNPAEHHPVAATMTDEALTGYLSQIQHTIEQRVAALPAHQSFLARYCPMEAERP